MIDVRRLLEKEARPLSQLHYRKRKAPVIVWNLVSKCNLSCRHCYAQSNPRREKAALSLETAKDFIDDISSMNPVRNEISNGVNIPALLFSGGEPLLREDIFELGTYAAKKGIYTALSTNGTLIRKGVARQIKDAQFSYVGISLDGLETTHDSFRRERGSFRLSVQGIENCLKEGIKTGARFTLTKYNYKDLVKLMTFLVEKKVNRFCLYHLVYSEKGRAKPEHDISKKLRRDVLNSFFDKVEEIAGQGINMEVLTVDNHADGIYLCNMLKAKNAEIGSRAEKLVSGASGCSAGIGIASIDSDGEVHPCQFWGHLSLGNIRERRFSEIWNDKNNEFLNMLRNGRKLLKGRCGRCKYKDSCGGCRLRAEKKFSDIWQEDPACYLTEEEIRGI